MLISRWVCFAGIAALDLVVAACGAGSGSTGGQAGGAGQKSAKAEGLDCDRTLTPDEIVNYPVPKAKERYKVTLLLISLAGYYYNGQAYGAEQAAEKAGIDLSIVASEGFATVSQQITQAQNALTRGTDAIVLGPVDVNGSVPIVAAAKKRGVPVITVGTLINDDGMSTKIVQDDYSQGQVAADTLAKQLPAGGEGIVMAGPANATWSVSRAEGFKDQVKAEYPNIKINAVANSLVDPGQGVTKFSNAASAHPRVDWIYPVYNLLLPPTSVPPQYKDAVYVSGGLEPTTEDAVATGDAVVIPDWPNTTGYVGVAHAVGTLNGEPPPALTCLPSPVLTAGDLDSPTARVQRHPEDYRVKR